MTLPVDFDKHLAGMLAQFTKHTLTRRDFGPVVSYIMREPGSCNHLNTITFMPEPYPCIVIAGDTVLGLNGRGLVSNVGYDLGWFASQKSPEYLCSKFLDTEYNQAAVVEQVLDLYDNDYKEQILAHITKHGFVTLPSGKKARRECVKDTVTEYTQDELYEVLEAAGGYDGFSLVYKDAPALCAVQQTFRRLYLAANASETKEAS